MVPEPVFGAFPTSLFKPFASPEADAYGRILSDLYAESCRAAQPLGRDLVLDIIISHTLTLHTADDPLPPARETLQYLQACGWLRTEVQPDFTLACVLTPYAFQLLQLISTDPISIPELLISIHDLLKSALLDVDNEIRLRAATRLTDQLLGQLKAAQHTPGLGLLPHSFAIGFGPPAVRRPDGDGRAPIGQSGRGPQAPSAGTLPDTARLRLLVLDTAAKLEIRGHAAARYIREKFQALNRLFNDIDARCALLNSAEASPSASAVQLSALLARLANADEKTFATYADSLLNLYCQPAAPDPSAPPQPSPATFTPDEVPLPTPSPAEVEAARRAVLKQLNRPVTPDRIRRLVRTFFSENTPEVHAADLVAAGQADLALLIQLRLHADSSLGYKLEDLPWAEVNGTVFRDFVLRNPDYVPPEPEVILPPEEPETVSASNGNERTSEIDQE